MRTLTLLAGIVLVLLASGANAQVASHCKPNEVTVWSCQAHTKLYSLCASRELDQRRGYVQYRAGKPKAVEFRYPSGDDHPSNAFKFGLLAHGASLSFQSGLYEYNISEDLKGEPIIYVHGPGQSTSVHCDSSTNSLTLNTTINLFKNAGVTE